MIISALLSAQLSQITAATPKMNKNFILVFMFS
ncbi:hypothetical protein [Bacteroides sp.]